jgi:hypothetical protein
MDDQRETQITRFPREAAIFQALSAAGGRYEAFEFVMKSRGDLQVIKREIQEQEDLIVALKNGPMKPGASPRLHKDAYISGLKEAIRLISDVNT